MAYVKNLLGPWAVGTKNAPRYSGVYIVCAVVWLGRPQVLYIGESDNIASRMAGHDRREDWEREARGRPLIFYAKRIEARIERFLEERVLIGDFNPPCNNQFTSKAGSPSSGGGIQFGGLGSLIAGSAKSDSPSAASAIGSLARMSTTKGRSPAYGLAALMGGSAKSDSPSAVSALASLCRDNVKSRS